MPKNDFSELDYKPKKKSRYLLPALIILTVLILMVVIYFLTGIRDEIGVDVTDDEQDKEQVTEQAEEAVPSAPEAIEEITEGSLEESEIDEADHETPPDHEQLGDAMHKWLISRVDDPDVIMVHTSELDDVESFLERYSLEEDNIIVYRIESTEDQFATAVFGLPYSEWSIRAVFIWRDSKWNYLREEALR